MPEPTVDERVAQLVAAARKVRLCSDASRREQDRLNEQGSYGDDAARAAEEAEAEAWDEYAVLLDRLFGDPYDLLRSFDWGGA